ncbi:GvpL/GvpF family gas vesicle protein [Tumidithrix elongata RA019]|uniref:GvpL/GvpF family gas vesicle protein n=1 Tax=Tumidithrix elongata BACA0141 TaxID=2716417 RepID=A0AAW9Q1V4_9CYAN|nr:GvpL/GvpF family gas vesicle protein [Tumidithrix elongata RA019]
MSLYLYAIFNAADLNSVKDLDLQGMNKQSVQFHALEPFAIAYSESQQDRYLASRANLLAHETVQECLMKALEVKQAVPLPLQFGLVIDDWTQVQTDLIEGHQEALMALLDDLKGKREVGIKLFWDQVLELNLALTEDLDLAQKRESLMGKTLSMDEAIEIGQELEAALEKRQRSIIETFLDALQPLCHKYIEGDLLTENMLYNASFLIDDDKEPQFAQLVESLDAQFENRLRIRYNNFTAPYNFVTLE